MMSRVINCLTDDRRKEKTVLLTVMRSNPRQVEVKMRKRERRGYSFEEKGAKGAVGAGLGKGAALLRATRARARL